MAYKLFANLTLKKTAIQFLFIFEINFLDKHNKIPIIVIVKKVIKAIKGCITVRSTVSQNGDDFVQIQGATSLIDRYLRVIIRTLAQI